MERYRLHLSVEVASTNLWTSWFFQARFYWGLCCKQRGASLFACLLPEEGRSLFPTWVEGRGMSRGWAGGVAWVVCPPLRLRCVQGACPVPCFCSGSSKVAFWIFGLFVSFVQNWPQLHIHAFILAPYSFFVFCCLKRGVSRCKHCSPLAKGSRSQSVSFP